MKHFILPLAIALLSSTSAMAAPVSSGLTDKGVTRPQNEDTFFIDKAHDVYVVADGMGGHAAGEVASQIAVDSVRFYSEHPIWGAFDAIWPSSRISLMLGAYFAANQNILTDSINTPAHRGMGTTMVSVILRDGYADVINVGDSRAYRIRNGQITQVSHDHSLVQAYIDEGILKTPEEIENFPYKNVITQAMGTSPKIVPDVFTEPQKSGDIYLLCSDGLFNEVRDDEILRIILSHPADLNAASKELVEKANANGGHDNITVVLVQL